MRALRVSGGHATLDDVPVPRGDGEATVRVILSGICNTDLELVRGYAGFTGTIGHELVGEVLDPGGGPLAKGTRVACEINAGCGTCDRCAAGDPRHCPARTVLGIVHRDGAHAEVLRLPARNLLAVPANVTDEQAVFAEPLAAACSVMEAVPIAPGTRVAVVGDGKLGILVAQVLAVHGAHVLLFGKHETKLRIAAARGVLTAPVAAAKDHARSFGVAVEASGSPAGFVTSLDLLAPQGTLVLKSTFHGDASIDTARIVVDEIRVVGSRCGRLGPAIELLARGAVDVESLISERFALERGTEALGIAARPGVLKVLLEPG